MRYRLTLALAAALAIVGGVGPRAQQSAAQPARATPPKLAVILVVDQMWAGYIDQFKARWTAGLRRFVDRGASFPNAAYPYLNTVTCVGHFTISTGALPWTHGMILNGWWDRDRAKQVACTEDPASPLVSYGTPVGGGESPTRLVVPTFTDELRAREGTGPRVVTFSLKPRSAIGLAGHAGDAVTWFSDTGSWVTSAAYSSAPVPFVADFIKANPVDKDFGASWTRMLRDDEYAYKDEGEGERPPAGWGITFPHVLKGTSGKPDQTFYNLWQASPFSDAYLGRLAENAVDALHLGQGPATDYLGVSFSATDGVGHAFGPRSQEIQDVLLRLDRTIGALLDHLDRAVGADRYVVALTADHGIAPIPEQLILEGRDAGRIDTNAISARAEQAAKAVLGDGKYLSSVLYTDVYFAPGVYSKLVAKPEALKAVVDAIRSVPGVLRVFRGDQLPSQRASKDPLERAASLSYFPGRSGDLIVVPKPYWILSMSAGTTHGSGNGYDQRVPVMFLGARVKAGSYQQSASPADIAPTLASLCGIAMPKAQGRVLREALTAPRPATSSPPAAEKGSGVVFEWPMSEGRK